MDCRSLIIFVVIVIKLIRYFILEFTVFRLLVKESYCLVNIFVKFVFLNGWKVVLMDVFVKVFDFFFLTFFGTFLFICFFNYEMLFVIV